MSEPRSSSSKFNAKAIAIMGPTASGKTQLAFQLVKQLPCDIVSVDSALVYRGMNIGTAKPSVEELQQAPHRLVDIRDVTEPYSAADFRQDALVECNAILARGRIPLLVGGTMLYFKALLQGLNDLPAANSEIRAVLEKEAQEQGLKTLHNELMRIDPASALRIHPNDPQRLLRALEIFRSTGQTMSDLIGKEQSSELPFSTLVFAVAPNQRSEIHRRIQVRFKQMIDLGFEQEAKGFWLRDDVHEHLPAMKSVGYRQMWQYFDGYFDFDEMCERAIIATRQLAKRQITWLRSWPDCTWIDTLDVNFNKIVENKINQWLF